MFVARDGYLFAGADYGSMELRVGAYFFADSTLTAVFDRGEDPQLAPEQFRGVDHVHERAVVAREDLRRVRASRRSPAGHVLLEDGSQRGVAVEIPAERRVDVGGQVRSEVRHGAVDVARGLGREELLEYGIKRGGRCRGGLGCHDCQPTRSRRRPLSHQCGEPQPAVRASQCRLRLSRPLRRGSSVRPVRRIQPARIGFGESEFSTLQTSRIQNRLPPFRPAAAPTRILLW